MPIDLALFGTSIAILKQASDEFSKLSHENKLDLRIVCFSRIDDFIGCICNYDIAAIYENDFSAALPKLTSVLINQSPSGSTVVIGMFKIPVSLKDLMVLIGKIPSHDNALDIPISNGRKNENIKDILYFENRNRRVYVKTAYDCYPTKMSMENVRELTAPYSFASPYVSYTVNLGWVEQISGRDILLKNREIIPLSQKKAAQFKNLFRDYLSKLR